METSHPRPAVLSAEEVELLQLLGQGLPLGTAARRLVRGGRAAPGRPGRALAHAAGPAMAHVARRRAGRP